MSSRRAGPRPRNAIGKQLARTVLDPVLNNQTNKKQQSANRLLNEKETCQRVGCSEQRR